MKSKKLLLLYAFLLLLVVATMFLLKKPRETARDLQEIRQEGVLRLITEYNPTGYYVSGDTIQGFQYELSQAISDISGLEVEIQLEMNLSKSFEKLNQRATDIIARNIPATTELKESYLFTDPVLLNKQVLVQRTSKANHGILPVRNQLHLAKKQLYVPAQSPAILRLRNLEQEIGDTIHIVEDPLYSSEQLIIMVASGDIDYAVCDQPIALHMQDQFPEIDINTDISFTQLQSWVVRKESQELLDSLNHWFGRIKESGRYNQIYSRYYK
ncbi:membrane-bound lytic murein transglycosylase F [Parabacteroides sp. PFB2-10]|uniref:transporter substrate-binding domain-containing protein n=1 Tax=Parabacteroides sp. PFB2-10 TaxID=1742405 RepID=UPI0024735417|nr:transporter substrate-binding domain-containing protein [Parabacteroides sp. PFB2-10]MDH6312070.1 membrane-bound lytic murein transglycosylase F [Parabacteroides sp. PFB2-10]MDL2245723.1 transporter substrate-binding domain-containing protein [Parabacteroides sp. OttesenSCG-928-J18]